MPELINRGNTLTAGIDILSGDNILFVHKFFCFLTIRILKIFVGVSYLKMILLVQITIEECSDVTEKTGP